MPRFNLQDVDVTAISLVKNGANGKRIALLKSQDESKPEVPHTTRLIKASGDDWSTLYCVVAEPGCVENGGVFAPDAEDLWASEEEIAKAAHGFMANGGLINQDHQDVLLGEEFKAFGTLVENAVALADTPVPGSTEVIKQGSWYIGVEPTDEGRQLVNKGEIQGVSIQGSCTRVVADDDSWVAKAKKFFAGQKGEEPVAKLVDDFATRQARSEFVDELYPALMSLEDVIWGAVYQYGQDEEPAAPVIERSIDQFKAWALGMVSGFSAEEAVAKATERRAELAWELPYDPALPIPSTLLAKTDPESKEDDEVATPDERLSAVESSMSELTELVKSVATSVSDLAKKVPEPEPKAPTPEELQEAIAKVGTDVATIAKAVNNLGAGAGAEPEDEDRQALAKFNPDKPLAGLLS
jgi:hypothetical protein